MKEERYLFVVDSNDRIDPVVAADYTTALNGMEIDPLDDFPVYDGDFVRHS